MAVRDFALPAPRLGSIEPQSGVGGSAFEGQALHAFVQDQRREQYRNYQSEVRLRHCFTKGQYRFYVAGRADGFFEAPAPTLEEIKTSLHLRDLVQRIDADPMNHSYALQLQTYGYIYWQQHDVMPQLQLTFATTTTKPVQELPIHFDVERFQAWVSARLDNLVQECERLRQRIAARRSAAKAIAFPFSTPRPGQLEIIKKVTSNLNCSGGQTMLQAPTGLGKTAGVMFPMLREAFGRGQIAVYVTPKNSQHSVAEDALDRFRAGGAKIRSMTVTAKTKLCLKEEVVCLPEVCQFAKDHHTKVHDHRLLESNPKPSHLDAGFFRQSGETHEVCPFQLQNDMVPFADVVICDYNYVLAPDERALEVDAKFELGQKGKPNLIIDEAHNVPHRAMDYYSPSVSIDVLKGILNDSDRLKGALRKKTADSVLDCIACIEQCRPAPGGEPAPAHVPIEGFHASLAAIKKLLSAYLDGGSVRVARDPVFTLFTYWANFVETLELLQDPTRVEFFTSYHDEASGGVVKITCCDASKMLAPRYARYNHVLAFSATLKPFEYYARLSGFDGAKVITEEFGSPYARENRKLLVIPQVSTKLVDRERNYEKIADAIRRIVALRPGNYLVSTPSFTFLERLGEACREVEGFRIVRQERNMKRLDAAAILESLRRTDTPTLLFAVQGGMFAEGVDYPGEMLIGAFVIGPPLPSYDFEHEEMRKYYQTTYEQGFDYTYTYPAMAKAIQTAGRVIRSDTDRGLIVLMDSRFLKPSFAQAMPADWFDSQVGELTSSEILADVTRFWEQTPSPI